MENKDMLKKVLRRLIGPLNQLFENLAGDYGETWLKELKKFLRKERCWEGVKIISKSFDFLSTVDVPTFAERFAAKEYFVINTHDSAPVRIAFMSDTFKDKFLNKVGDYQGHRTLCFYNLLDRLLSFNAIMKIFDQSHCVFETSLRDIWALMKKQPHGEKGSLDIVGQNVFCVDCDGQWYFVVLYLLEAGWGIETMPADNKRANFGKGTRFFIRY